MEKRAPIYLYTDGAASGNPGPGGYGVVLVYEGRRKEMSGGFRLTTNNRMELLAVIRGLEAIRWTGAEVEVYSDSTYVVNAVEKGWIWKWQANGYKGKKNKDLWERFIPLYRLNNVHFHWLKGHAGHPENGRCDTLAVAAYSKGMVLPPDEGYVNDGLFSQGES